MEQQELDSIITALNNPTSKYKPKSEKRIQPREYIPEEIAEPTDPNHDLNSMEQFQRIYDLKIERDEERKRKKLEKVKRVSPNKPQQRRPSEPMTTLAVKDIEEYKGPTIRYLQFKNWSGLPLPQNPDRGYKFKFIGGAIGLIKNLLEENGFLESSDNDVTIIWNNGVPKPETLQGMSAYQKINHFPRSFEITRKDLMHRNISKMQARHGMNHFNFIPKTYILPSETSTFLEDSEKLAKSKKNQWYIVKPHNQSQGRGIWLTDSVDEILKKQKDCIVVSHYINNPLLINNLKFDMRIYVGITCFHPLRIYMYEEGLARFATYSYSKSGDSKENPYVHLTNYSLNKYSDQFVANEDENNDYVGHKWSLTALKEYLKNHGFDLELIWGRIEDLVVKSIISIEGLVFSAMDMSVPFRDNCFEILGFDVLVDADLRPWLLEINLSPSMNTDSPMDLKIKGSMVADMMTMIGVVPVDQRYSVDKTYLENATKAHYQRDFKKDLPKHAQQIIRETDEELKRSRGWKNIYPTSTAMRYKQFFEEDRPFNRILREQELQKVKHMPNSHQTIKQLQQNPQMGAPKKK